MEKTKEKKIRKTLSGETRKYSTSHTLKVLSDKLFQAGILPYYLHLLDKVQGASHFYISDEKALQIYKELQALTSGYLVPKLAREIGGEPNKTLYTA